MILFAVFFALVFTGMPIAYCLGISSIFSLMKDGFNLTTFASTMYSGTAKFSLLAIPFSFLQASSWKRLVYQDGWLSLPRSW